MNKTKKIYLAPLLILAFMTVSTAYASNPSTVNLGTAGNFVILTKSGVSTVPTSVIVGDVGVSPISATAVTGFSLTADATNVFSTSPQVTGKIYASNYTTPTPSNLTTAVSNMETAYTDAAGRPADVTELGAGNIGGLTITPGVYKWGTGVTIPTDVTLSGNGNDVWIFQIGQDLDVAGSKSVVLSGGAKAKNIFWQVAGQVNIGTNSHFEGIILSQTAIHMKTGSSINGRLLAQTAVTLESSAVTDPGNSSNNTPPVYTPPTSTVYVPPTNTNNNTNPTNTNTTSNSTNTTPNFVMCSQGQLYSIVTGQICTSFTPAVYCPAGGVFSMETGQRCTTFTPAVYCPVGGVFSTVNGQKCTDFVAQNNNTQSFNFGTRLVVSGTSGAECQAWQMFFNAKAGANLSVDSICGPLTMSVAKSWQRSSGLQADGILGPLSRAKAIMQF